MKQYHPAVQAHFRRRRSNACRNASAVDWNKFVCSPGVLSYIGMLACFGMLVCAETQAAPRTVTHSGEATNSFSEAKTDFHIRINSDTAQNVTKAELRVSNGSPINGTVTEVAPDFQEFTVDWDANIPVNAEVEWEIRFEQNEENVFQVPEAYFTPRVVPSLDLPLVGWDIDPAGIVLLTNGGSEPIVFTDLAFQFPSDLSESFLRLLLENPSAGLPGLITAGTIPAGGKTLVAEFPDLNPGDFVAARLNALATLDGVVPQVLGHEHQVPEPGTMLILGLFLTCAALLRFQRVS